MAPGGRCGAGGLSFRQHPDRRGRECDADRLARPHARPGTLAVLLAHAETHATIQHHEINRVAADEDNLLDARRQGRAVKRNEDRALRPDDQCYAVAGWTGFRGLDLDTRDEPETHRA